MREKPLPGPRIASVVPSADTVAVREGARQSFSVVVDGKPADEPLPVEWKLDGKVVAANATRWDYQPSYKAATGASREVDVVIGSGTEKGQVHSWRVKVEDVNRPPVLRGKPHPRIEAPFGKTVALRVTAVDEDDDQLAYRWTVDGKPAGTNAPELKVVASTNHTVSLAVSDGKDTVTSRWQIAAIKPVRFSLDFTPKRLDTLQFDTPQRFALMVPRNAGSRGIQYAWRVDGNQVSDARTFVFKARDPSIVRSKPVSITATARNAQGQHFSHEWQVRVIPPPPEIVKRSPSGDRLGPGVSERVSFSLQGRAPLGNQRLSYVYEVDGKRVAQGGDSRFTFQPQDDEPHAVTAYIEDNYRQVSRQKIRWTVQASGIVAKVRDWLKEYERAWNAKDARKLGQLRGLDAQLVAHLAESLKDKVGLRVKFSNV
ncbi:MAG: hypothetical protein ACE5I7_20980, partial [Candidatus Binatia bacterium]